MRPLAAALRLSIAGGLAVALGCASSGSGTRACEGLTPPRLVAAAPATLPPIYSAVRLGGTVTDEVVVGRDGAVRSLRFVWSAVEVLAPFAQFSIEHGHFTAPAFEGNPVAVRGAITVPVGTVTTPRQEPVYDALRAFVPGGSREARWQLAGSVDRLTLVAHVGQTAADAVIVAIAPGGAEKVLLPIPATPRPHDVRETVKTGRFLLEAGDYRLELRAGGKAIASTTVTIAAGFESAIVNACEPLLAPEKTGPGH